MRHLETKHPEHAKKYLDFKRHERCLKSQKIDASGSFQQQSAAVVEDSYENALEIAKQTNKSFKRLEKQFYNPAC